MLVLDPSAAGEVQCILLVPILFTVTNKSLSNLPYEIQLVTLMIWILLVPSLIILLPNFASFLCQAPLAAAVDAVEFSESRTEEHPALHVCPLHSAGDDGSGPALAQDRTGPDSDGPGL